MVEEEDDEGVVEARIAAASDIPPLPPAVGFAPAE